MLFIELKLPAIPSLCSELTEAEQNGFKVVRLDELTDAPLPDLSVVQCDYLPTPIYGYLLKKASLVVCEGQGVAQQALLVGTPCLHSPKNSPHAIYDTVGFLALSQQQEKARVALKDASSIIVNNEVGCHSYMAQALNDCFHSDSISGFCTDCSDAVTLESDRFAFALVDAVDSKKVPGLDYENVSLTGSFARKAD